MYSLPVSVGFYILLRLSNSFLFSSGHKLFVNIAKTVYISQFEVFYMTYCFFLSNVILWYDIANSRENTILNAINKVQLKRKQIGLSNVKREVKITPISFIVDVKGNMSDATVWYFICTSGIFCTYGKPCFCLFAGSQEVKVFKYPI